MAGDHSKYTLTDSYKIDSVDMAKHHMYNYDEPWSRNFGCENILWLTCVFVTLLCLTYVIKKVVGLAVYGNVDDKSCSSVNFKPVWFIWYAQVWTMWCSSHSVTHVISIWRFLSWWNCLQGLLSASIFLCYHYSLLTKWLWRPVNVDDSCCLFHHHSILIFNVLNSCPPYFFTYQYGIHECSNITANPRLKQPT